MPALTDRERAKRAKMVARFNAIKHQTSMTSDSSAISGLPSVASSLPVEDRVGNDSSRLDDYLSLRNQSHQPASAIHVATALIAASRQAAIQEAEAGHEQMVQRVKEGTP